MINEQENKTSLNDISSIDYKKNSDEMMRYRVNGLSYKIGLLAMVFSIFGAFICLNSIAPYDIQTIFIILLNVVVLLGGFLAAEMVKNYSHKGAIAQMVFGVICIARIFYVPLQLIIHFNAYIAGKLEHKKYLSQTIIGYYENSKYATAFLPADGNFRAIVAIVSFALAGVCFIVAGIIGYQKANKLNAYMDSLNNN